jgi:ABC-type branched-subunit amino acid transport system substrate-binding protein
VITRSRRGSLAALAAAVVAAAAACSEEQPPGGVQIGVLLSYSGRAAASTINSERALLMAIDAANAAGGVSGRPITLLARDTQSDPLKIQERAQELLDARLPVVVGPDNNELAVEVKTLLSEQTLLLPSFTTTEFLVYKPFPWFVMGAASQRIACELMAQVRADGRLRPITVADAFGYNTLLAFQLTQLHNVPQYILSGDQAANERTIISISAAGADAYILAALPPVATSLIYSLAALRAIGDPARWYLSPTLHTPEFLETIPKGVLEGAHGVAVGAAAGAGEFVRQFEARWGEPAMDAAYSFYDAGAIAALALQRALTQEGAIPSGSGLAKHIVSVTRGGGVPLMWNEIGRGMELLRQGQEIGYVGLNGLLEFDLTGQSRVANTAWWTIRDNGFQEIPRGGDCR